MILNTSHSRIRNNVLEVLGKRQLTLTKCSGRDDHLLVQGDHLRRAVGGTSKANRHKMSSAPQQGGSTLPPPHISPDSPDTRTPPNPTTTTSGFYGNNTSLYGLFLTAVGGSPEIHTAADPVSAQEEEEFWRAADDPANEHDGGSALLPPSLSRTTTTTPAPPLAQAASSVGHNGAGSAAPPRPAAAAASGIDIEQGGRQLNGLGSNGINHAPGVGIHHHPENSSARSYSVAGGGNVVSEAGTTVDDYREARRSRRFFFGSESSEVMSSSHTPATVAASRTTTIPTPSTVNHNPPRQQNPGSIGIGSGGTGSGSGSGSHQRTFRRNSSAEAGAAGGLPFWPSLRPNGARVGEGGSAASSNSTRGSNVGGGDGGGGGGVEDAETARNQPRILFYHKPTLANVPASDIPDVVPVYLGCPNGGMALGLPLNEAWQGGAQQDTTFNQNLSYTILSWPERHAKDLLELRRLQVIFSTVMVFNILVTGLLLWVENPDRTRVEPPVRVGSFPGPFEQRSSTDYEQISDSEEQHLLAVLLIGLCGIVSVSFLSRTGILVYLCLAVMSVVLGLGSSPDPLFACRYLVDLVLLVIGRMLLSSLTFAWVTASAGDGARG